MEMITVEVSNKMLALLLLLAIVVSVAGTFVSLNRLSQTGVTGYAVSSDSGTAKVNVQSNTVLRFTVNNMDFGTGYVNTTGGYTNCTMNINTTSSTINKVGCVNFNTTGNAFLLQNAGTTFLNITINSTQNASTFIGGGEQSGVYPLYQYMIANNLPGSCAGTLSNTTWTNFILGAQINICTNLSYVTTNNTLAIGVQLEIPYDSNTGQQTATIVAQGTSLP